MCVLEEGGGGEGMDGLVIGKDEQETTTWTKNEADHIPFCFLHHMENDELQ